MADSLMTPR